AIYTCYTISQYNDHWPPSFGITTSIGDVIPARAMVGFTRTVSCAAITKPHWDSLPGTTEKQVDAFGHYVSAHAFELFDLLDSGKTLKSTLKYLKSAWATLCHVRTDEEENKFYEIEPMIHRGDPMYTSKYVYLTEGERLALGLGEDSALQRYFVHLPVN
ncbi:MAG: hypothetical protein ACOCX1_00265, partial [Fimbriimonadaceae bacterium]